MNSHGTAPPILLVHGLGVASRLCAPTAEQLAHLGYHCVAPDLPGFGRSSNETDSTGVEGLAIALQGWLEGAAPGPVAAVGVSLGTQVVADLAGRAPHLVAATVLISPIVQPSLRRWRRLLPRWQKEQATQSWRLRAVIADDFRRCGLRRLLRTTSAALHHPIEQRVAHLGGPVLVVRGSRDPLTSTRWARELATVAPHGRLAVVPDGVHAMTFENPCETARVIDGFVRSSAPAMSATPAIAATPATRSA